MVMRTKKLGSFSLMLTDFLWICPFVYWSILGIGLFWELVCFENWSVLGICPFFWNWSFFMRVHLALCRWYWSGTAHTGQDLRSFQWIWEQSSTLSAPTLHSPISSLLHHRTVPAFTSILPFVLREVILSSSIWASNNLVSHSYQSKTKATKVSFLNRCQPDSLPSWIPCLSWNPQAEEGKECSSGDILGTYLNPAPWRESGICLYG